ncbi:DUF1700 domain-containing protein [Phenylobacterium aquaticum]|uniref:DUF1700 domain-containing protein n=1 Tax=Phenylobacterium aquaticum TaxID=1763816 RepID=UPI001F5D5661|nr:DUF1700 domain-containing protein [Phenylobacterium aquaticum]MCI3134695.1 DUF1700 domain-containing protein [Phenylobacterium aquaticum]
MSRQVFMSRLREGLRGLPQKAIDDIAADYEAHFAEGEAAGRSEADVAAALGDPGRLARELRAEADLKRWEEQRNPSAAANAVFAVLGLGALDVLILLPILLSVAGTLFGFAIAAVACFGVGGFLFAAGPFIGQGHEIAAVMLAGLGVMAGATSIGAVTTLVTIAFVNGLVWYGRLHMRLLKPALEPQGGLS